MLADELFPASKRVIYDTSPLTTVICQLRFPTVLRIEAEVPASFQEAIRDRYPLFERGGLQLPNFGALPVDFAQILGAQASIANYIFRTEDGQNTLTLTPDSIALTSTNYGRWEDFNALLQPPLAALVDLYKPASFSRIGLRYQNAIRPALIGVQGQPWADLIKGELLGEMAAKEFQGTVVEEARRVLRIRDPNGGDGVLLQHGIGAIDGDPAYLIDFDFYLDTKAETKDATNVLDRFHRRAGRAFRWCITPALHEKLGPVELD